MAGLRCRAEGTGPEAVAPVAWRHPDIACDTDWRSLPMGQLAAASCRQASAEQRTAKRPRSPYHRAHLGLSVVRILVLEDDPTVRRAVIRVLRANSDEIIETGCCAEARVVTDCALGVFDVDLPDGDGIELAEELLGAGRIKAVVFHTGRPFERAAAVGVVVTKGSGNGELRSMQRDSS